MLTVLSLVTSVKDYIEIAHKLIESQNGNVFFTQPFAEQYMVGLQSAANLNIDKQTGLFVFNNYTDFGAVLTYIVLSFKEFLTSFFSFAWFLEITRVISSKIWSLPLIVPDIASAMISEVSVLDSYFTNAFSFLETGLSASNLGSASNLASSGNQNTFIYAFEKFITGFINSLFLVLPTSTAHLITLRRFVVQGLEAGYIAGLGTIAGNVLWLASIILGWRFIVIPWLSFDIFRYILGFSLLVKYLWDSSKEFNKTAERSSFSKALDDNTKKNIFVLNFLLALTEQTSIYPFISNLSFGPESSVLESFYKPAAVNTMLETYNSGAQSLEFLAVHGCYLFGILLGCFSLLQFSVWFWENPAFSIYMWMISSYRVTTSSYYKIVNFIFLYLTMLCAISSIPYFGLDYTLTNPLGLIPQDRIIDQKFTTVNGPGGASAPYKILQETAFLGINPTDKNTRIRDGIHARRERWKERLIKYQAFDASLYDQGSYDILTIEDLNYGFERFWLRRKLRNHQIRFRLFPGPWMRSLKKQLNKPGFSGPRVEFFRILFEQYYHPIFHATNRNMSPEGVLRTKLLNKSLRSAKSLNLEKSGRKFQTGTLASESSGLEFPTSKIGTLQKSLFLSNTLNNSSIAPPGRNQQELDKSNLALASKAKKNLISTNLSQALYARESTGVQTGREFQRAYYSTLRKFSRNFNNRLNTTLISGAQSNGQPNTKLLENQKSALPKLVSIETERSKPIYSKALKYLFSKITEEYPKDKINLFRNISRNLLITKTLYARERATDSFGPFAKAQISESLKNTNIRKKLSKKERLLLANKMFLLNANGQTQTTNFSKNSSLATSILGRPFGASLEPLKYYLRKDEALKRKFKYYSTSAIRNLSVGNNAPYFKTMLKRAFYYHKPSLRWKRTMFAAAMRRGFRKKSSSPKKLVYTTNNLTLSATALQNPTDFDFFVGGFTPPHEKVARAWRGGEPLPHAHNKGLIVSRLQNPIFTKTSSYSVLGKRASRYRYQIYKDVLQHWYYSPFNRLLLKFDVDSFISRQPKSHFLTKKEERLLHLRRLLLSEHYNSLRWYTYMQHYNTMKSNIGSTKSFASTVYNQQFQGTFKKIRHLFAITPIQGDMPVLQFDQPLYNSTSARPSNTSKLLAEPGIQQNKFTKFNLLPTYLHEGLQPQNTQPDTRVSAQQVMPGTQNKLPGRYADLIEQSLIIARPLSLSSLTGNNLSAAYGQSAQSKVSEVFQNGAFDKTEQNSKNTKEILFNLLKEYKRRVNNPVFLKNYITHRLDKREQRNNEIQNELKKNLESLQNWLSPISVNRLTSKANVETLDNSKETLLIRTTGVRKALNDGVFVLNNIDPATSIARQRAKSLLTNKIKNLKYKKQNYYISTLSNLQKQEQIKQTLQSIKSLTKATKQKLTLTNKKGLVSNLLKQISNLSVQTKNLLKQTLGINKVLSARTEKSIEWWRQKQRVMTKRKSSRKKARFKNIKASYEQNAKIGKSFRGAENFDFNARSRAFYSVIPETNLLANREAYALRKKQDFAYGLPETNLIFGEQSSLPSESTDQKNLNKENKKSFSFLKTLFLKKFNSKRSSKGSRYRYMSTSRGFAYVRRPKNANNFLDSFFDSIDLSSGKNQQVGVFQETDIAKNEFLSKQKKLFIFKKIKDKLSSLDKSPWTGSPDLKNIQAFKNILVKDSIKKSPIQKRSKRSWKKRKRHKLTKNHYKYRKRNIHGFGKLRNLNKKLKKIKTTQELQNWWWNIYLPNYVKTRASASSSGAQNPKELAYKPLSTNKALEIRERRKTASLPQNSSNLLSTSTDSAIITQTQSSELTRKNVNTVESNILDSGLQYNNNNQNNLPLSAGLNLSTLLANQNPKINNSFGYRKDISGAESINNLAASDLQNPNFVKMADNTTLQNYTTTNIPFYAGWDESLRKFVVTNRLLSRRDTGFRTITNLNQSQTLVPGNALGFPAEREIQTSTFQFTKAPIQGLNEGSFLYLQTEMPFNSYIIDQFIPNNQSFYAPLGWKRFQFRHSLLKNWQNYAKSNSTLAKSSNPEKQSILWASGFSTSAKPNSIFLKNTNLLKYLSTSKTGLNNLNQETKNLKILQNKRIKKRYKLLKQTPIQLMYVPTGALLNEILPSHYVSVFDKQYRVPRNRYLKRYLPTAKTSSSIPGIKDLTILEYSNSLAKYNNLDTPIDFTLRKKVKPRRKYHKKRLTKKDGLIFPVRYAYRDFVSATRSGAALSQSTPEQNRVNLNNGPISPITSKTDLNSKEFDSFRLRPSTKAKQTTSYGAGGKSKSKKRLSKPVRLRQLRNRELKQVYKPLQRFQPRAGGFVWPGDYLRFEIVPMPKLKSLNSYQELYGTSGLALNQAKTGAGLNGKVLPKSKVKRKINVQPVGLLPRKYLLEKHNLKVLKKKLSLSNS